MTGLINFIKSHIHLTDEELQIIISKFKEHSIKKGKFILKKGQIANKYYFIQSGLFGIYFDKNEKQFTGWLATTNDFFTEINSLKFGQPSQFYIRALEDSTFLTIEKSDMELLYRDFPVWQQFGRQVWEEAFIKVLIGIISHQTSSAEERYMNLMKNSDLLQKVPLKELASFLGITPTSLSRIRKNIK